jgi:hypothetical protein
MRRHHFVSGLLAIGGALAQPALAGETLVQFNDGFGVDPVPASPTARPFPTPCSARRAAEPVQRARAADPQRGRPATLVRGRSCGRRRLMLRRRREGVATR